MENSSTYTDIFNHCNTLFIKILSKILINSTPKDILSFDQAQVNTLNNKLIFIVLISFSFYGNT